MDEGCPGVLLESEEDGHGHGPRFTIHGPRGYRVQTGYERDGAAASRIGNDR